MTGDKASKNQRGFLELMLILLRQGGESRVGPEQLRTWWENDPTPMFEAWNRLMSSTPTIPPISASGDKNLTSPNSVPSSAETPSG